MSDSLKKSYIIYIYGVFSMIFWGMSFIWTSIVFKYYHPITTIFLRLIISTLFIFGILFLSGKIESIRKEHYRLLLLSAVFNPFLYFLGENYGLKYSSATISAVIIATIPVFTPIFAYLALKERLSPTNIAGIVFSFAGILVMLINPDLSLNAEPKGIIFLLFAVAAAITYSIFLKKLLNHYRAITIIAYQNFIGIFLFLPLFIYLDLGHFLSVKPTLELISSLGMLAILASSLAFILFAILIKHKGVSRAAAFSNLIPIFTAIFSYFILAETFNFNKIAGMIIVIGGLVITQIKKKKT